jgi:iron complex transport system substrate-binding protein
MRIVSLLPSATEMLCALGLEDQLVGITHSCDYPETIMGLPRVTSTVIPGDAPPAEVDRLVRERLRQGQPLYRLDEDLLRELAPDLLVTQGLCDVCAVPDRTALSAASRLPGRPPLISLEPTRLGEVLENLLQLGARTGTELQARMLVSSLEQRMAAIRRATEARPPVRVTLLEWLDPLYACGHWSPELVGLAGGRDGHGRPGKPSRLLDWKEVQAWRPEVLIVACCGLDVSRARKDLPRLQRQPGFDQLPAVAQGRVYFMDGRAHFSRPGPRLVEGLERLAELLHPGAMVPGRAGAGILASFKP